MIRLYGTPLSHFTRKIRILLIELAVNFEFIDIGNVGDDILEVFQNNPLMRVPIIKFNNNNTLFESDNIAQYIINNYDSENRFCISYNDTQTLNIQAVISGIMEAEVKIILAERSGMENIFQYHYFQKTKNVITNGLKWLCEQEILFDQQNLTYQQIACVCMWDHLLYYKLFDLTPYNQLQTLSNSWNKRFSFASTNPN